MPESANVTIIGTRGRFGIIETPRPRSLALTVIGLAATLGILYFGRLFFMTAITAVIISFILEPFVRPLMRLRLPRSLASLVVCAVAGLLVYAAGFAIYTQTAGLVTQFPQFSDRLGALTEDVRQRLERFELSTYKLIARQPPPQAPQVSPRKKAQKPAVPLPPAIQEVRIHHDSNPVLDYLYARLASVYEFLLMASFVPFLVYFMLSWGDHVNATFLQFFEGEDRAIAARSLLGIASMVRAFVVSNFLLGVLVAVLSCLGFWLVSVPFPLLSGTLSGFFSIIPYVGLPLGLIPPLLAAVGGSTTFGGVVLIVVIVGSLHVIALNLLYPKLVGSRVHLNPLVVTFAIMFWGFLWDAGGLLLAIPITAAIKAVCDNVQALRPYGRFLGD